MTALRILLVDDHSIVRAGFRRLIEKKDGLHVVAEAADAAQAYVAYKSAKPDVVVMDISMPGRGGIDATRQIRQWDPKARVLIFSMHASTTFALQAFRAGALGFVTKSSDPNVLVSAIYQVGAGKPVLCPEISEELAASHIAGDQNALDQLSPREFEILRMILDAKSADYIADTLNLSPKTVNNYHYAIKSKLGVSSDIDLVYYCMRHGLNASG
jgi:two-component system invasion response regulator UvrY